MGNVTLSLFEVFYACLRVGCGCCWLNVSLLFGEKGFEVTVIDRQEGVALETSFANAGQISPGYSAPWAAPGIPFKAIKWLHAKTRTIKDQRGS